MPPRSIIQALAALSLFALLGCRYQPPEPALRADQSLAIDRLLATQAAANQIPGLAVAVIRNGEVVKRVTLGVSDIPSRTPVTSSTPFQLASTSKSFTSTSVLILVADGRVRLDARIGDLLEGLPPSWQPVTVRQLLSHTSGLPDIVRVPGRLDLIADTWEQAFPMIEASPMQFPPGERWAYTQTNYVLLAKIVERVSGKPLEAFMTERLFQPLGMRDSFFASPGDATRRQAVNYEPSKGGEPAVRALDFPPYVHAAGGLCASLDDLIRWNAALDSGRVLPPALATEMWTATKLNNGAKYHIDGKSIGYGLGWVVDDTPAHAAVGHSGGNSTAYRRYLDEGLTIIVLHNGVADPDGLVDSIASIVRSAPGAGGAPAQDRLWDAAIAGDSAEIERALRDGADIEALDTRRSKSGRRALNWAAWHNHPDAIRVLLEHGAKIDAENKTGFTALHHAAEAGSLEAAEALLAAGANPAHPNRGGTRPAETARAQGHGDVATRIEAAAP